MLILRPKIMKTERLVLKESINVLFSLGFKSIITGAFEKKLASIRVMEKCNMKRFEKTEFIEYRGLKHKCVYYKVENKEGEI